ncbi:hypothetical protein B0J13DRAFT_589593 [Dactylonectria estremocensis]|uniref:Uncharacterized protein n=1 Tax=Dactylonectria estremocensis TaxID=1079267 RepID=A0A9P9IJM6_9HYPO|nr:hypothetical protein B0J13DRAFT_589593 [Dactylonectria estremocensis]
MEIPDVACSDHNPSQMQCCCGRVDCALLKRNSFVLESVEKDVHTAAQLGQALLARHEAYMADAERDRLDLNTRIGRLEMDKQELEAENAVQIEENRALLDQLELLNNTVSESDTRIKALEASLLSSQQAVRHLETTAFRASDTERYLALLEQEQEELQQQLQTSEDDARSHAQRFKEAQRGILDMQDQLERMETEARHERQRHAEVVGRMERQREVDKHLDTAAGRLKGAAASKSLQGKNGNPVVNHFVRDLLEDNANLQLGMAELRELLLNSNDEIQSLRDQMLHHQPIESEYPRPSLKAELEGPDIDGPATPRVSHELHIHHHYHVTPKLAPKPEGRKLRRKRHGFGPGSFTSPTLSGHSTPNTSGQWRLTPSPTAPALLSLTAKEQNSVVGPSRQRWSTDQFSEFASSVPSSPQSNQRNSMFDPNMTDSDYPMSPATSFDPMSPTWTASHRKGPSEISTLSFQTAPPLQIDPGTPPTGQANRQHHVIHEEDEDEDEAELNDILRLETPDLVGTAPSIDENSTIGDSDVSKDEFRPRIHRAVSHESIMSLAGGLDIHTLKARPSQLTLRPLGGAEAILTDITAQPTLSRGTPRRSAMALRDTFIGLPAPRSVSGPLSRSSSPNPETPQGSPGGGALGKWVGWRPWGASTPTTVVKPTTKLVVETESEWNRAPGINQPGAIPGFQKYWAAQRRKGAPSKVLAETVDRDALQEVLEE